MTMIKNYLNKDIYIYIYIYINICIYIYTEERQKIIDKLRLK